jgi:hypothetical protein
MKAKEKTFTLNLRLTERERARKKRLARYTTWRTVILSGLATMESEKRCD